MTPETLEPRRLLASPEVDLTFGNGGLAKFDFAGEALLITAAPNGKVVVVGSDRPSRPLASPGDDDPFVARFNADGTPDASFDGDGFLRLPQDDGTGNDQAAVLMPDGKIVLIHGSGDDIRVFRFNADGTVDTSFGGGDGFVDHAAPDYRPVKAAVQPDGRIVLAGRTAATNTVGERFVSRLNADGSVDAAFRGGLQSPAPTGMTGLDDVTVGPHGKIYLSGTINPEPSLHESLRIAVVARFNADGTPDTAFGDNGFADIAQQRFYGVIRNDPFSAPLLRNRLTVNGDGTLLVLSRTDRTLITRFTTSGVRDATFGGGDGIVSLPSTSFTTALTPVAGGKFVFGIDRGSGPGDGVVRVNADGSLDATFGNGGMFLPDRATFMVDALGFDADGNILMAGLQAARTLAIARLVPASPDVHLDDDGTVFVAPTDAADTIAVRQEDDQLVVELNGGDTSFALEDVSGLVVFPSDGDDVITVSLPLACTIEGGDGNDAITVGDGQMSITGGGGNDVILCGTGAHAIDLGAGENRVTTGSGNDTITGEGNDTIFTGPGGDLIHAGDFDDSITTSSGWDTIYAGAGDDTVRAGAGDDLVAGAEGGLTTSDKRSAGRKLIFGGDGDDDLMGGNSASTLYGGAGDDGLDAGDGSDYLSGGPGDDRLLSRPNSPPNVHAGDDTLKGDDGNDNLRGGPGDDFLFGGPGDDTLFGSEGNNFLDSGEPEATAVGPTRSGNRLQFMGTSAADAVSVWADGDNLVVWRDGVEQSFARAGVERIVLAGNGGNDYLKVHASLTIPAVLFGGDGDDQLIGGGGSDILNGDDGNDHLSGGGGHDQLDGGFGADSMRGGAGFDRLDYRLRGGGVVVALDGAAGDGEPGENDFAATDFEEVYGGAGNDRIDGGPANNILWGGAGSDTLGGGDGFDHLFGEGGNDVIDGNGGDDSLYGGTGIDTLLGGSGSNSYLDHHPATGAMTFHGSDARDDRLSVSMDFALNSLVITLDGFNHPTDTVITRAEWNGYGGADVFSLDLHLGPSFPVLFRGGVGDDVLLGGGSADTLRGGEGNDHLNGGIRGRDSLFGEGGNDKLFGGDADDYLEGGAGHDLLHGGSGSDALFGLAGNDRLLSVDDFFPDRVNGGAGIDSADAGPGNGDEVVAVETVA